MIFDVRCRPTCEHIPENVLSNVLSVQNVSLKKVVLISTSELTLASVLTRAKYVARGLRSRVMLMLTGIYRR